MRALFAAALALGLGASFATAEPRHGISAFGDLKYAADFKHFDYVNPNAPKGGRLTTLGTEGRVTFDSLNYFILKGVPAQKLDLVFDTLMVRAQDEPDAMYGLVAETADIADDGMSVTFKLRKQARFADGTPLTASDVANTFRLFKEKGHPRYRRTLADVVACDIIGPHKVRYRFKGTIVRDLPLIVAALPIFSKAYYDKHDFSKTTLKPPLGSGPYRITNVQQGQSITYELRQNYWAKALPVNRGRHNFAEIKLLYFRERTAELEALKAGTLDLREEFTSKSWQTEYDIEQVRDGRIKKVSLPDFNASGAQGYFINMRRKKFADVRTRKALALAFDYEWTNKNLFYGLYKRTTSVFENSAMKANGVPSPQEKAVLDALKGPLRKDVYGPAILPPVSDGSGQDRSLLRKALVLLKEAGWKNKGRTLIDANGKPLTIEFLLFSPSFERVVAPYVRNLRLIGVDASIRLVEASQFQHRVKTYDFDILVQRYTIGQTPGVEMFNFFGSEVADQDGSFNLAGVKLKVVDMLIEQLIKAKSREALNISARALDRVLRAEHFWVPHWYNDAFNVAYWDIFGFPKTRPKFDRAIFDTWWIDRDKLAKINKP